MDNEYLLKSVHEEFAKRVSEENDRQNHRLSSLENTVTQIGQITSAVERLATNMEHMVQEQKEQGDRLKTLESKDGDMWRTMLTYVLTAIISIILGFVARGLGM